MAARNVGNLDIARGPNGTVELRVRHTQHMQMDPQTFRYPPTLVLLADAEVQRLIQHLEATLKEPCPKERPKATKAAPPEDNSDLA